MVYYWLIVVFLIGAAIGSFLNVVIARLPLEKSLIWPGSHCGSCFQPIRWYDNFPLLSYLWLRGRCRTCRASFSVRYFGVELITGLCFAGLFYLEVVQNIHRWPNPGSMPGPPFMAFFPWQQWPWQHLVGFVFHAVLLAYLLAASGCDMAGREIPFPLTLTGTLIGLTGSALMPWPWPGTAAQAAPRMFGNRIAGPMGEGIYAWPVWWPLPNWLEPGTMHMGLATGLAGMLAGTFMLRSVGFIFSKGLGKEGLGLGDADLMMMVGSFLGWQLVVVAFFVSVMPGLVLGIFQMVVRKDHSMPFGPSLAAGSILTCLCWGWIVKRLELQPLFFWGTFMLLMAGVCAVFLLMSSLILRLLKRS